MVDADLSQNYDTIPHHELMLSIARRILGSSPRTDRDMLRLIKQWLKAPVETIDGVAGGAWKVARPAGKARRKAA